jgi:hypothetical protein
MAWATLLRSVQEASVTGQQAAGQISDFTGGLVSLDSRCSNPVEVLSVRTA